MRIDKFLWSVRIYKTRSIASDEIKKNKVAIGEQVVKNSKEVKVGDLIKIKKNQIELKIKVRELPKSRVGAKLVPEFITDCTDKEQYELLKLRQLQQSYYRAKGEGRPTKKDRRDIDGYLGPDDVNSNSDSDSVSTSEDHWDQFFKSIGEDSEDE